MGGHELFLPRLSFWIHSEQKMEAPTYDTSIQQRDSWQDQVKLIENWLICELLWARGSVMKCMVNRWPMLSSQNGQGQLIFYDRPDSEGPKLSQYAIAPTNDPAGLGVRIKVSPIYGCLLWFPKKNAERLWGS